MKKKEGSDFDLRFFFFLFFVFFFEEVESLGDCKN